jgi:hypothetical protein
MASRDLIGTAPALGVLLLCGCASTPGSPGLALNGSAPAGAALANNAAALVNTAAPTQSGTTDAAHADDPDGVEATRARVVVRPPMESEDDLICRREAKTGTHRRKRVCRTRAQIESERRLSQEWIRSGGRDGSPIVAR